MATDSLTAPLGKDQSPTRRKWRVPLVWIGLGIIGTFAALVALWIVFVEDPLGGEPFAIVAIERKASGVSKKDVEVVDIRPSLPSGDDKADQATGEAAPAAPLVEFTDESDSEVQGPVELSQAPVEKVTETGQYGPLPKTAEDGARPLDVYAAPAARAALDAPRIVLVVTGIGLSQTTTQQAITDLPPGVTLAFAPYGSSLDRWMRRARQQGHELLLQVPLEPFDFPDNDPGPHTLLTKLAPAQNLDRLHWILSRTSNYVGVINYMGARFTATPEALTPMLEEFAGRGLLYFDDGTSSRSLAGKVAGGLAAPFVTSDLTIDAVSNAEEIDTRLLQLESLSRSRGLAVGVASALPVSIERIADWSRGLEARGVHLVPPSFVARTGKS